MHEQYIRATSLNSISKRSLSAAITEYIGIHCRIIGPVLSIHIRFLATRQVCRRYWRSLAIWKYRHFGEQTIFASWLLASPKILPCDLKLLIEIDLTSHSLNGRGDYEDLKMLNSLNAVITEAGRVHIPATIVNRLSTKCDLESRSSSQVNAITNGQRVPLQEVPPTVGTILLIFSPSRSLSSCCFFQLTHLSRLGHALIHLADSRHS